MDKQIVLVTGANGELGHGLIALLAERGDSDIVAVDLHPLDASLAALCRHAFMGDILDRDMIDALGREFRFDTIFHLAALLSTSAERKPHKAHQVNVNGTLNMLEMANEQGHRQERVIKFIFPSSIAVYGMPPVGAEVGKIDEDEWLKPATMYGANKLYCEHLGRYYSEHYRQLDVEQRAGGIDFRSLRFPGLISAVTVPSGGTSDYIPEMLHHAAQGLAYACFVREDARIPFMAMPDSVKAILKLAAAPREKLTRRVYNVTAFNPSAGEFNELLKVPFPDSSVTFEPGPRRQAIVDSWPVDVDDSAARRDWGWQPDYDLQRMLNEYLIPTITARYQTPA